MKQNTKTFLISFFTSLGTTLFLLIIYVVITRIIPAFLHPRVEVPSFVDMSIPMAQSKAQEKGIYIKVTDSIFSEKDKDVVVSQIPEEKKIIYKGDTVYVIKSKGKPFVMVPDVRGLSLNQAKEEIIAAGLIINDIEDVYDNEVPTDTVAGSIPEIGKEVEKGSRITLLISIGPEMVEVPNILHKKFDKAKTILENAGLEVGTIRRRVTTEYNRNYVLRQRPRAGDSVKKGTKVNITLSDVLP